jgi:hypothetical protein
MKHNIIIYLFLLMGILFSCKSSRHVPTEHKMKSPESLVDLQWHQKLATDKSEFLEVWHKNAPYNIQSWVRMRPALRVTKGEEHTLDCIPVETFVVSSQSLSKITKKTSVTSILTLKKDEAHCFLIKNNDFLVGGQFDLTNERWKWKESTLIRVFSETLPDLYFNKKKSIFHVRVNKSPDLDYDYYVYIDNGEFWTVNDNANLKTTLLEHLLKDKDSHGIE